MPLFNPDELKTLFRLFAPSELDKKGFFYVGLVLSGQRTKSSDDVPQSALYILNKLKEKGLIKEMKKGNIISYNYTIDLDEFLGFAKRSYDSKSRLILWSLFYYDKDFITFNKLAKVSSLDKTSCRKIIRDLERKYKIENIISMRGNGCEIIDRNLLYGIMWRLDPSYDKRRPRAEEYIFEIVDREEEIYGKEIYDQIGTINNISKSAMYKAIKKLEEQDFLILSPRKEGQGAYRDYVSVNCNNCLRGYSSKEKCWNDSMIQLIQLVDEVYKRKINTKDLNEELEKEFDGKPQLLHKIIFYLAHLQQLNLSESKSREKLYLGLENITQRVSLQEYFESIKDTTIKETRIKYNHFIVFKTDIPLWLMLGRLIRESIE